MIHVKEFGTPSQIRGRVLKSRNKTPEEFDALAHYNEYLSEVEGIINDFVTGSNVAEASNAMKTYRIAERNNIELIRRRQEKMRSALYGKKSKKSRERKRVAHVAGLLDKLGQARYDREFLISSLAFGWLKPSDIPKEAFTKRKQEPKGGAGRGETPSVAEPAPVAAHAELEQVYLPSSAKIKGTGLSQPMPISTPQSTYKRRRTSRRVSSTWELSATGGLPRSVVDVRAKEEAMGGLFVFGK